MIASFSLPIPPCNRCAAARPIAAAVFRPTGSARICDRGTRGSCCRTAADCTELVTIHWREDGKSGASRAAVCSSMVSRPTILSNCFGVHVRLRGQKRVPRPPARITAWAGKFPPVGLLVKDVPLATRRFPQHAHPQAAGRPHEDQGHTRAAVS